MQCPVGFIGYFGITPPPSGWVEANGQELSRVDYAGLFQVYGTTYGTGDGSTTFNVPDCRGRVIAHPNNGTGRLTKSTSTTGGVDGDVIGSIGGEQVHVITTDESSILAVGSFTPSGNSELFVGGYDDNSHIGHNNVQPTIIIPAIIYAGT